MSPRWRPVLFAGIALVAIWIVAVAGYTIAKNAKATPEKVKAYVESVDLSKLSAAERAKAIRKLADMLNKLSLEDRRRARLERLTWNWFNEMTEEEKGTFLEATMPTGFKQMLTSFEQLPEEKRKKTVDDALRRLKEEVSICLKPVGIVASRKVPFSSSVISLNQFQVKRSNRARRRSSSESLFSISASFRIAFARSAAESLLKSTDSTY